MLGTATIRLVVILAAAMLLCISSAGLANGELAPVEMEEVEAPAPPAMPPAEAAEPVEVVEPAEPPTVTEPIGRGPVEAAAVISVAPIAQIRQRGHVLNACEAEVMGEAAAREKGGIQSVGDYQVAYMLDPPASWYEMRNGQLTWRPPAANETQHIEVIVADSLTGKPLPVSPVTVDVINQQGEVVQSQRMEYYWDPMADHYGANYAIPTAGEYTLRVRAPAPDIRRHNRDLGNRFADPLDMRIMNVRITPQPVGAAPEPSPAATPGVPTPPGDEY